jgi:uncharacterized short protein YbdD (DUF466 family)
MSLEVRASLHASVDALKSWWRLAVSAARLAVGIPDYDAYVAHQRRRHPELTPLSYEAFFAERLAARYGKGRGRCC